MARPLLQRTDRTLRLLLDTNAFLWLQTTPERLKPHLDIIGDLDNERLISTVCAWEITIKYALKQLPLPQHPRTYVPDSIRAIDGTSLVIEQRHALEVADLPHLHRDPFDRLLVAQARLEGLTIVTADAKIQQYPVETLAVG